MLYIVVFVYIFARVVILFMCCFALLVFGCLADSCFWLCCLLLFNVYCMVFVAYWIGLFGWSSGFVCFACYGCLVVLV